MGYIFLTTMGVITNEIFFVLLLVAGFTGFRPFQGGIAYCTADGDHKLWTINLSS